MALRCLQNSSGQNLSFYRLNILGYRTSVLLAHYKPWQLPKNIPGPSQLTTHTSSEFGLRLVSKIDLIDNKSIVDFSLNIICSLRCAFDIWPFDRSTGNYHADSCFWAWLSHSLLTRDKITKSLTSLKCSGTLASQMQVIDCKWIKGLFLFLGFHGLGSFIQNLNGDCFWVIFPLRHLKMLYNIKTLHRRIQGNECVIII